MTSRSKPSIGAAPEGGWSRTAPSTLYACALGVLPALVVGSVDSPWPGALVTAGAAACACALATLRRRRSLASLTAAGATLGLSWAAASWGGLGSPSLYVFSLVIVGAALAQGARGSALVAVSAAAASTTLLVQSWSSVALTRGEGLALWLTQIGVYVGTAVLVGATIQRLRAALRTAWESERASRAALAGRDAELRRRTCAEDRLRAAVREAERANEAKSQFLANMSHELRTPLNAIIGYSELLIEDADETDKHITGDLFRIRNSGKHLLALINDILDLAKIESGRMKLVREWFDVSALVNEIAGYVIPMVDTRGNMLVLDLDQQIGKIHADPVRVRQVLLNLLSNAAKFTEDGTVIMRARRVDVGGVEMVRFSISDTGIGISEEQLSQLFRPFVQADCSTSRRFGGTGLGLVLCARFVEMMEGSIEVESVPGEGSTFTITLPVHSASAHVEGMFAARVAEARRTSKKIVLCVDEEPAGLDLLCRGLEGDGSVYPVPVRRARDCLALASELEPSAVTLDVRTTGVNGWSLLEDLVGAGLPVVVISIDDDIERSRRIGAVDHIVKPLERARLQQALTAAIARGRRAPEPAPLKQELLGELGELGELPELSRAVNS